MTFLLYFLKLFVFLRKLLHLNYINRHYYQMLSSRKTTLNPTDIDITNNKTQTDKREKPLLFN